MIVLALDTETTGLIGNHTIRVDKQPYIIEFYGCIADLTGGGILDELHLLIRPPQPLSDKPQFGDKKTTEQITGISNAMLAEAKPFAQLSDSIIAFIQSAPLVVAHNLSFDKEVLDIEAERVNKKIAWPRGFCTVEQTVHLKGKRLSLSELHEHLFDTAFSGAHRANVDTAALVRCLVELHKRDVI